MHKMQTRSRPSVISNSILHSPHQWIPLQEAMFQPTRFLHHFEPSRICLSGNRGRLTGSQARYLAALRPFLTVWRESLLLECHWFQNAHVKGSRLTSHCRFRSSRTDVNLGLPDLGRSLVGLVFLPI